MGRAPHPLEQLPHRSGARRLQASAGLHEHQVRAAGRRPAQKTPPPAAKSYSGETGGFGRDVPHHWLTQTLKTSALIQHSSLHLVVATIAYMRKRGALEMQDDLFRLQVVELPKERPEEPLELFSNVPNLQILVMGGDGTAGWILSCLDAMQEKRALLPDPQIWSPPPVAVIPLGTGIPIICAVLIPGHALLSWRFLFGCFNFPEATLLLENLAALSARSQAVIVKSRHLLHFSYDDVYRTYAQEWP